MDWPHAPAHRYAAGTFFVTAGTLYKEHMFRTAAALDRLQENLFESVAAERIELQAWSLLSNHYHLVVQTEEGEALKTFLRRFHSNSAKELNRADGMRGRRVWFQFWETELTYERSWLARLRYTQENAVHHRIVTDARVYRWCSASWFEKTASTAFAKTLRNVRMDLVRVSDDFVAASPL